MRIIFFKNVSSDKNYLKEFLFVFHIVVQLPTGTAWDGPPGKLWNPLVKQKLKKKF